MILTTPNRLPSMATVINSTVTLVKHSLVPKKWEQAVRIIGMSECKEVALSLAHAFAADDLACYLLDTEDMASLSPEDKWRLHVDIFNYLAAAHILRGEVHAIGPEYEGVALWMPPGEFLSAARCAHTSRLCPHAACCDDQRSRHFFIISLCVTHVSVF